MEKYKEFKLWNRLTTLIEISLLAFLWTIYGFGNGIVYFLIFLGISSIYIRLGYLKRDITPFQIVQIVKVNEDEVK